MYDLAKYLPPTSIKGGEFDQEYWNVRDKELKKYVISFTTKEEIPISTQDELEDKHEDYSSIPHE